MKLSDSEKLLLDAIRSVGDDVSSLHRIVAGDADVVGLVRKVDRLRWQMRIVLALCGILLVSGDHRPIAAAVIKEAAAAQPAQQHASTIDEPHAPQG